ncbi:hypothetical protein ACX80L_04905 [Arthrobacter sp. MDT1-48-3]
MATIDLPAIPAIPAGTRADDTVGATDGADPASAGAPGTSRPATDRTDVSHLPVLDRRILDNLGVELSNQEGALQFAGIFGRMLPQRIGAVQAAFAARDADAAVVALLSLTVSASMVGARRLEDVSSAGLQLVDRPSTHPALLARLQGLGTEFQSELAGIIR